MVYADLGDDTIVLETKWSEKELVKVLPGSAWNARQKFWTVPLSWATCLQLRGVFGEQLEIGPKLTEWSWNEFTQRVQPSLELRNALQLSDGETQTIPDLYPFQFKGTQFLNLAGDALIGDELGTGKTIQALAGLKTVPNALPALVIGPNSVKTQWEKQARRWLPEATPYVVKGSAAKRRKILDDAVQDPTALVIINLEAVRLFSRLAPFGSISLKKCRQCDKKTGEEDLTPARCEVHPKPLNGFGFKTVIIDEAHRLKDPQSKQTRACWSVAHDPSVLRRWAMTGTPIANHIGDLWSIMHLVAPYEWQTKSKWVDRYALQSWNAHGGLDIVGINPAAREEFYKILDPRFRRVIKAQVSDQVPQVVRATRWVEMVPKQEKAYRELESGLVTRLEDGQLLIAPGNLVKATRLLQLSSSYADVEMVRQPLTVLSECKCYGAGLGDHADDCHKAFKMVVTLIEPSPKLDAMEEAFDELGGKPLVIAAESRQLIMLAAKRFEKRGVPHGLIVGGVGEYDRQRVIERFQDNELNVILFTIKAGGTGVDGLQRADTLFFLQRSWSMIENIQTEGRVNRFGSERHNAITVVDFVTENSIEDTMQYPRLAAKFERLEEINRDRARRLTLNESTDDLDHESGLILGSYLNEPITHIDGTQFSVASEL